MKIKDIRHPYFEILILILAVGLTSCQVNSAPETDLVIQSDLESTETPEIRLESEPISSEDQEADNEDECLLCHSDKQTLIDTANPVVVLESESSGEG